MFAWVPGKRLSNGMKAADAMPRICFAAENGVNYAPTSIVVLNAVPALDEAVKIAFAATNSTSSTIRIVRKMSPDVTTSVVTEPPVTKSQGVRTPLSLSFDSVILHALAPKSFVEIGSLTQAFPGTTWQYDGGGQFINWPDGRIDSDIVALSASAPTNQRHVETEITMRAPDDTDSTPRVVTHLGVVPGVFAEGLSRHSTRIKHVDGVDLRDGDVVNDAEGHRWYFRAGRLSDRLRGVVSGDAMRVVNQGRAITPRRASQAMPKEYVPGALYELVVKWPEKAGGGSTPFRATSFPQDGFMGMPWGWNLDATYATVEHPRGRCQGKHGTALDFATPQLCALNGGTWDRPCETDTECPFYDPRQHRGACEAGFCEMPLGVDRKSFRTAADSKGMMLRGCDPTDPTYPYCDSSVNSGARFPRRT